MLLGAAGGGAAIALAALALVPAFRSGPGEDAARLCRSAIPAINQDGATITLGVTRHGPVADSLRIVYVVQGQGRSPRSREIICRFERTNSGMRIAGIATEAGPLADTSFFFLRRFYLEQAGDPPPDPATAGKSGLTGAGQR